MVEKEKKWTEEEYKKWLSYDKTKTINEETKWTERDKHDFLNFCWYNRKLKKVMPGSTKINEDKNGEKYSSIEVKRGDCPEFIDNSKKTETKDWIENNIQTERNELRLDKENDFKFNEDFKYKFSFKIPENFPLSPTRLVIWQWKYNKIEGSSEKWDPSPMLAQRIQKIDWKYYFTITDWIKKKNILRKIPFNDIKGKWVNMDYELRFSDKKDENGNPIPCTVKLKADIEWERKIDEKKEFYLAEENNLQFNSKESHSGYFKFWLYRDNYDYAKTKIKDKKGLNEIEQAQKAEEQNPMQIYFKNFSMENLGYKEREDERDEAKRDNKKNAEKLQKFYDLYLDTILAIKSLKKSENISQILKFLNNPQYEEKTKKCYEKLFEKLNENSKILDDVEEKIKKQNIEELLSLKKKIDELKLIKYYQKLKKYEKWEFINLPNWLSYEVCIKNEEEKYWKSIPVPLWENEYFIKTHVDEDASYTEYVSSLLEIKKLLENKWIKIKYCKRNTRLANRDFIVAYEAERKKRKWNEYKKSSRLKVLEDTERAEISYKIHEDSDPSRFIREGSDLWNYIISHKESFKEAEMRLDLDKLEELSQGKGEKKWEDIESNGKQMNKTGLETSEKDDIVRKSYVDAFLDLVWDNKELSKVIENLKNGEKMELSIKDVELIQDVLCNIQDKARKNLINEKFKWGKDEKTAKAEVKNLGKYCMDPKAIKKYKLFNCSGASFMIASIIESLWWTVYLTRVYHHVICMTELQGKQYAIDTNHNRYEDITDRVKIEDTECNYIKKFTAKTPLFKEYTEWYVFGSLHEAEKIINWSNYQKMNEPKYEEACKKITELLTEEKINSYPKDFPMHVEFPEFDRKIYDIQDKLWKESSIIWKTKLKIQERLVWLKRLISRKK